MKWIELILDRLLVYPGEIDHAYTTFSYFSKHSFLSSITFSPL